MTVMVMGTSDSKLSYSTRIMLDTIPQQNQRVDPELPLQPAGDGDRLVLREDGLLYEPRC